MLRAQGQNFEQTIYLWPPMFPLFVVLPPKFFFSPFWRNEPKSRLYNRKQLHKFVQDWPLKSTLDPETYGPTESAITKELIEKEIGGSMTVEEVCVQYKFLPLYIN